MRIHSTICGTGLLAAAAVSAAKAGLPVDKVYGVNIGSWLLTEPWMLPNEWQRMGGEICDHCADCAASEFALTQKLGQEQADKVFAQHWATWFTQDHVNKFADGGLNSVRIALGFWIVEGLVDRKTEFYPRGGLPYLKKGLAMLKAKGIHAILDFHAMPGVSAANQMYAGRCTSDLQFYASHRLKDENYNRALIWGGVMTAISHMDPDFSTVFAIEAINNPVTDYSKTPGLGDYQRKFVKVVRLVELVFGITCTGADYSKIISNSTYDLHSAAEGGLLSLAPMIEPSLRPILQGIVDGIEYSAKQLGLPPAHVKRVVGSRPDADIDYPRLSDFPNVKDTASSQKRSIKDAAIGSKRAPHGLKSEKRTEEKRGYGAGAGANTQCLSTTFTTKYSQYNNPPNPADFAIGPQIYDAHLYYTFGQGADPNAESYLSSICNTNRVSKALADNNSPLIFGEFTLATNFADNSTFRRDWADAQKYVFASQADGWIFWNFRVEEGSVYSPAWSYLDSLAAGYFTKDPAKLNNPDICKPWMANGTSVA